MFQQIIFICNLEGMRIRDRIREPRRVPAGELLPHAKNWRRHPPAQAAALRGLLKELGYAAALIARETAEGKLELIDGHLRAETTPDASAGGRSQRGGSG